MTVGLSPCSVVVACRCHWQKRPTTCLCVVNERGVPGNQYWNGASFYRLPEAVVVVAGSDRAQRERRVQQHLAVSLQQQQYCARVVVVGCGVADVHTRGQFVEPLALFRC